MYVCTFISVLVHLNEICSALISSRKVKPYAKKLHLSTFCVEYISKLSTIVMNTTTQPGDDSFSAPGFEDCTVGESACRAKGWFDTGSINGVAVCCPPGQGLYIDLSNKQHPCLC